jgi:hypothetical protein
MKEIKLGLNRHELVPILKLNRKQGIDFYLPKSIEIKDNFSSFIFVDYQDAYCGSA